MNIVFLIEVDSEMQNVIEFQRACEELGLPSELLAPDASLIYLNAVADKFRPRRMSGHVAIDHDSVSVPLEKYEFTFSQHLAHEPVYVFFDQLGSDKGRVVVLRDGQSLGCVLERAFGMEYFVSNEGQDYLLAVNWYVIEGAGAAIDWLTGLDAN